MDLSGPSALAGLLAQASHGAGGARGSIVPLLLLGPTLLLASLALLFAARHWRTLRRNARALDDLHQHMAETFALAIEARDPGNRGHALRVRGYALEIGQLWIDLHGLPAHARGSRQNWLSSLGTGALLHDVGKIGLPDHLLRRDEKLVGPELEKMRQHAELGAAILGRLTTPLPIAPMVRHHHENWDGSGYPERLRGESIPLEARIIALAKLIDRPEDYAEAKGSELLRARRAIPDLQQLIATLSGDMLDPRLAELYCRHAEQIERAVDRAAHRAADGGLDPVQDPQGQDAAFANIGEAQRESAVLYDLARHLGQSLEMHESLEMAIRHLSDLMPLDSCALYLLEGDALAPRVTSGPLGALLGARRFMIGEGLIGWSYEKRQLAINEDPRTDLGPEVAAPPFQTESAAILPLIDEEGAIGVLAIYARGRRAYADDHRRILETAGPQIARALRNALMFEASRTTSMTDALTELPNSRFLSTWLEQELARSQRRQVPLMLAVLDLDGFKAVNDTYGHQAGDETLRLVSQILRDSLRVGDVLCRYAGDEFVAVLPDTTPEEGQRVLRRVQQRLSMTPLSLPSGPTVQVGASIGMACFPLDGDTPESLFHRADKEMYHDKSRRKAAQHSIV